MAERPQLVGGFAGRAIGAPGFAQMPVGGTKAPLDVGGCQRRERFEKPGPDLARRAVLRDVFVGNSGQADIVAGPLRHAAMSRTGLASLTSSGLPHHAILLAHFSGEAASASRGSREIRGCVLRAADPSCRGGGRGPETAPAAAPPTR